MTRAQAVIDAFEVLEKIFLKNTKDALNGADPLVADISIEIHQVALAAAFEASAPALRAFLDSLMDAYVVTLRSETGKRAKAAIESANSVSH
jgi:hypothetical protein